MWLRQIGVGWQNLSNRLKSNLPNNLEINITIHMEKLSNKKTTSDDHNPANINLKTIQIAFLPRILRPSMMNLNHFPALALRPASTC
jgi:hypothetical protein